MNDNFLPNSAAFQKAVFETLKAKHKNSYALFSTKSDPFLIELADMILLLSAQIARLSGVPLHRDAARPSD